MPRDVKSFRITEFKGLNSAVNPQNVEDEEFTILTNAELTKGRTIQARKGYVLLDTVTGSTSMSTIYKTYWDDGTNSMFYCDAHRLWKWVDGSSDTLISLAFRTGYTHPQLDRYKEKVLVLFPGQILKWMNQSNTIVDAEYPTLQVETPGWSTKITATSGGTLEQGYAYQYNISLTLGNDFQDGETAGALPGNATEISNITDPKNPPPVILQYTLLGDYARVSIEGGNTARTATASGLTYTGCLNGFEASYINLFRRKMKYITPTGLTGTFTTTDAGEDWVKLEKIRINKVGDTYEILNASQGVTDTTTSTVTYDSGTDTITISLSFVDDNSCKYNVAHKPRPEASAQYPKPKYMTRLYNRVFLANIESSQERDKKLVWYSYRPSGNDYQEINGFLYEYPMLVFPPCNTFYCDMENVEDEITAITTYQDSVVIFTNNCMYLWREGMSDPARISSDVGCVAQHSIQEFEGKLVWLAKNGVYTFNGSTIKNISYAKINEKINTISWAYAGRASSCLHERRYWIVAPTTSSTVTSVFVYDFDLDEWHERYYRYTDSDNLYLHYIYSCKEGNSEVLYGSGITASGVLVLVKLETGYSDRSSNIVSIIKTKYFDFGAPDIQKTYRTLYLDLEDFTSSVLAYLYIDNKDSPIETITCTGSADGFIVNSTTDGIVNSDYIQNVSDEMFGFSLNRGLRGSRIQLGSIFYSYGAPAKLHAIVFDWRPSHKVRRRYGDGS